MKSRVPCKHPGCPELVSVGQKYCDKHKHLHPEEQRSASARGYNSKWRRESKKFLEIHPLCVRCIEKGIATPATVVDYIIPHRGDQELFWDRSNWQPICKKCHDRKTMTEDKEVKYSYCSRAIPNNLY